MFFSWMLANTKFMQTREGQNGLTSFMEGPSTRLVLNNYHIDVLCKESVASGVGDQFFRTIFAL